MDHLRACTYSLLDHLAEPCQERSFNYPGNPSPHFSLDMEWLPICSNADVHTHLLWYRPLTIFALITFRTNSKWDTTTQNRQRLLVVAIHFHLRNQGCERTQ